MRNNIAVCFASDEKYLQHATVAMTSFAKNNASGYDLIFLTDKLGERAGQRLQKNISKANKTLHLKVVEIDDSLFSHFSGYSKSLTQQAFYRLIIADTLIDYEYALYIDCDTVTLKNVDFKSLVSSDRELSAVRDIWSERLAKERGLSNYFNSGVLFLNLTLWRERKILQDILQIRPRIMTYADQELLNVRFENKWFELTNDYNFPPNEVRISMFFTNTKRPRILHFIGAKPWEYFRLGALFYWMYVLKTDFKYALIRQFPSTLLNSLKYVSR